MSLKKKKQVKIILSNPLDRREFIGYELVEWGGRTVARLGRFILRGQRLNGDKKDIQLTRSLQQRWEPVQHMDVETYKKCFISE